MFQQSSLKSYKIASFKEFFKRLYSEFKLHQILKSLSPKLVQLLHKLKRIKAEQTESFKEISSINNDKDSQEDQEPKSNRKSNIKNIKSPLSTIIEQSDHNPSDGEESKGLESNLLEAFGIIDSIIPNENKIINQYKLELKNLALEVQSLEETEDNEVNNTKSQENLDLFKKLYEKENQKLMKVSKRFEALQINFDKMQDLISILQQEKEKLLKELEKEKKNSYKLQIKRDQDKDKDKNLNVSVSERKLNEKESFIQELQKQVKGLQNSVTKTRSELALSSEAKSHLENELKMMKNVKELLEKENERMGKTLEKKEKYIRDLIMKIENPNLHLNKITGLEESNNNLKEEIKRIHTKCEDFECQVVELQYLNKSLFKKEEVLDLKHKIDQLEYELLRKKDECERNKANGSDKINNITYLLEADKKRIRELEESMLKLLKENKNKEEEIAELKQILNNYSDLGRDLKGIKKKLFN